MQNVSVFFYALVPMRFLLSIALVFTLTGCARCDIIVFEFDGGSPVTNILGEIDTIANTFSITSFTSADSNYRIPNYPLVLDAIDVSVSTSAPWDVPDSATLPDIISALDGSGPMFLLSDDNADHTWDAFVSGAYTVGWGGGVVLRGTGSETVSDTNSNFYFRWPWSTNGNNFLNFSSGTIEVVPIPEPSVFPLFCLAGIGLLLQRRRTL